MKLIELFLYTWFYGDPIMCFGKNCRNISFVVNGKFCPCAGFVSCPVFNNTFPLL